MNDAIQNRISRRSYIDEPLSQDEGKRIRELVDAANAESGLDIEFLEDGSSAFSSIRTSYGMFSGVRAMLIMKGNAKDPNLKEKVGYYGEEIVLNLTKMGLGTCWVGLTFDGRTFDIPHGEELVCVILLGHVKAESMKEKMIHKIATRKKRKPVEERIETTADIPDWVRDGLEAVRIAPSAKNTQKPLFHYDGNNLTCAVPNGSPYDKIDLGIAKKHFEIGAGGKFDIGDGGVFHRP